MTIKLDLTKRQLGYIIAAMSGSLQTDDITEFIRDTELKWACKAMRMREYAERCELLAKMDSLLKSAVEEENEQWGI